MSTICPDCHNNPTTYCNTCKKTVGRAPQACDSHTQGTCSQCHQCLKDNGIESCPVCDSQSPNQSPNQQQTEQTQQRTVLVDGRIPAYAECPYRSHCEIAQEGFCHHRGIFHDCEFSCGSARAFELIEHLHKERNQS